MRNSRLNLVIEINLLFILFLSVLLQGAVADIYWYPVGLLVMVTFCASLLGWEQGRVAPPRLSGLEPYLIVWISLMIISAAASPHRGMSTFALERLMVSLLFFYLMLWHFQGRTKERVMVWSIFFIPVLFSLLGIGAHFSKTPDFWIFPDNTSYVRGTMINHNNFAALIILAFFLGAGLIMSLRRKAREFLSEDLARRALLSIPLLVLLLALAFSLSRGGWIACLLAALGLAAWVVIGSRNKRVRNYLIPVFAIILLAVTLSLGMERKALSARAKTLNEFFVDPASGLSLAGRTMLWESAWDMVKDHPGLGIGPGAFWAEYPRYRVLGELHGENHAHNDLLQLAAESGTPSALAFLALLLKGFAICRNNYRRKMDRFERRVSLGIVFGIFGFLFQDLFDFHFHIPALTYYFLALCAFLLKPREEDRE